MQSKKAAVARLAPRLFAAALLALAGCGQISHLTGGGEKHGDNGGDEGNAALTGESPTAGKACVLRVAFATLLQEHVVLLAAATDADLGSRPDEFKAAQAALDQNAINLSNAVTNVFDGQTGDQFLALWRKQNADFIDYANGQLNKDQDAQDKASAELEQFNVDFGTFMDQTTGSRLTKDAMADMMKEDLLGIRAMIDAQAAKDFDTAYTKEMVSEQDAQTLAATLADEFVAQFPAKY
jgi:hypothetical protein